MAASASVFSFPSSSTATLSGRTPWHEQVVETPRSITISSGCSALDQELPNGGWPSSVLIELLLTKPGSGELQLLAPALSRIVQAGKTVLLVAPPHMPLAAGLNSAGLTSDQVTVIKTDHPMDRIAAIERAMQNVHFGALLCWLPQARSDHMRRLQSAAADCRGLVFLLRPLAEQYQSSPAPLRMICQSALEGCMTVDIIKRRGPVRGTSISLPLPGLPAVSPTARTLVKPVCITPCYQIDHAALSATAARHRASIAARTRGLRGSRHQ